MHIDYYLKFNSEQEYLEIINQVDTNNLLIDVVGKIYTHQNISEEETLTTDIPGYHVNIRIVFNETIETETDQPQCLLPSPLQNYIVTPNTPSRVFWS